MESFFKKGMGVHRIYSDHAFSSSNPSLILFTLPYPHPSELYLSKQISVPCRRSNRSLSNMWHIHVSSVTYTYDIYIWHTHMTVILFWFFSRLIAWVLFSSCLNILWFLLACNIDLWPKQNPQGNGWMEGRVEKKEKDIKGGNWRRIEKEAVNRRRC